MMSQLREDSRKIWSDHNKLQLQYDDKVYNGGAWKKEKEHLGAKIEDVTKAYETAIVVQGDQQLQIVACTLKSTSFKPC